MKIRRAAQAVLGVAIGGISLWLALRGMSVRSVFDLVEHVDYHWIELAGVLYVLDLSLRIVRWRILLLQIGPIATGQVAEALIVGYAFNNFLPARLGEFVRADYFKARFNLRRSSVLGSIMIERLLDGLTVIAMFFAGMAFLDRAQTTEGGAAAAIISKVATSGGIIMVSAALGLVVAAKYGRALFRRLPNAVETILHNLVAVVGSLRASTLAPILAINLALWLVEAFVLYCMLRAAGVDLGIAQLCLTTGAVSLSTLVPTAPGFLGTYQYVFALCMDLFGMPRTAGILAAGLVQVFLLGTVTGVGLIIYAFHGVRGLARQRTTAS
jgi:uncharacterized protein (TIRG00374 family)